MFSPLPHLPIAPSFATLRDTLAVTCILAASNALLILISSLHRRRHYRPETTRKLLHLGMGLVSLSYPFLFTSRLPVILINGAFLLLLAVQATVGQTFLSATRLRAGAFLPPEQTRPMPELFYTYFFVRWHTLTRTIDRQTLGEFYFPVSITLLFLLTGTDPLLFCIPVLILTISDALAALVGTHYGLHPYRLAAGRKSLEGSAAFLLSTFLLTQLPLLLSTPLPPLTAILIALTLSLSMTLIEALSWRGLDNLLLPVSSFALLSLLLRAAA